MTQAPSDDPNWRLQHKPGCPTLRGAHGYNGCTCGSEGAALLTGAVNAIRDAVLTERKRCLYWVELWDARSERWRDMPMDGHAIRERIITNIMSGLEP